jgi:hypothetical protein
VIRPEPRTQHVLAQSHPAEGAFAGVVLPEEKADRERGEQQGFGGQSDQGTERGLFPHQPVAAPGGGQGEGDPRRAMQLGHHDRDPRPRRPAMAAH